MLILIISFGYIVQRLFYFFSEVRSLMSDMKR